MSGGTGGSSADSRRTGTASLGSCTRTHGLSRKMRRPCPPPCPNARSRIAVVNAARFSAAFCRRKASGALLHEPSGFHPPTTSPCSTSSAAMWRARCKYFLPKRRRPRLAPLYDLLATVAYPELSPNLAMKMGGAATLGDMDSRAWATFAGDATLGLPLVRRRVTEISDAVKEQANEVARTLIQPGLDQETLSRISELVVGRAERCARTVRPRLV